MPRTVRFIVLLVASLAALAWIASRLVERTARAWFERDVALRADLALSGARRTLVTAWLQTDHRELLELMEDVARDERIKGLAACDDSLPGLARTRDFPVEISCDTMRASAKDPQGEWRSWQGVVPLREGRAYLSVFPLRSEGQPLGAIAVVHDLGFMDLRTDSTRRFLLLSFGVLAALAALVTTVAGRLSWRSWSEQLRHLLRGSRVPAGGLPLSKDLHDLIERIRTEKDEAFGGVGSWTAARLKRTLEQELEGDRVIIVANREPYIHDHRPDGSIQVLHPASGLVTALEPVMRACSGVWVAHGAGKADRETADRRGRIRVPPGEESYVLRRVWLTREQEKGYYYGFSNEGLWPLCHIAHARPQFRMEDWKQYQEVNRAFAEAVLEEVDSEDPVILVQDYHFALVPQLIRQKLPRATVLMFWHIPWPNAEQFGICPWRAQLLEGMLGASILGFHTQLHCNNFLDCVDRYMESRIDREETAIVHGQRNTLVRAYPISVEWPSHWGARTPDPAACREQVIRELGLPPDALIGVGVDRLDYTKGIEERLLAVERLLERWPTFRNRFSFVQLAAPSRTAIDRYRALNQDIETLAKRINERFGKGAYQPIILHRAHHEPPTVFRFYRAADLCYVSSLHDGMNLVAKEFVSAREDERGVLVLSQFTGAARELTEALIVNPYDLEESSAALASALRMPVPAQRERMRAMRALVSELNVYRWAGRMLVDAARVRRKERLSGKLMLSPVGLEGVA